MTRSRALWRAFLGFGLWAICFTLLYVVHALGCTWLGLPAGDAMATVAPISSKPIMWLLATLWAAFVFWLVVLTVRSGARVCAARDQQHRQWMLRLTFISDIVAVVVTLISGLPVILTPVCL